MAEETVEIVVAGDCAVDGEAFLVGEVRSVPKGVYRALRAAGRVCTDPELAELLKAERARLSAPVEDPAAAEAKAKAEAEAKEAAEKAEAEAKAKAGKAKG